MDEGPEFDASFYAPVRQGFIFDVPDSGDGFRSLAVISQTCDVVLPKRPTITFCRVETLAGEALKQAETGASPRYVSLPAHGSDKFADLSFIETHPKSAVVGVTYSDGVGEDVRRDFSLAMARWFGRFAFPNEVFPWLNPLEALIKTKYDRNGSLGELLRTVVVELRVEADWRSAPYQFMLHTIVRAESLPTLSDDVPKVSPEFLERLQKPGGEVASPTAVAEVIMSTEDPVEVGVGLAALAESFASVCMPHAKRKGDPTVMNAVTLPVDWRLWSDEEFPYSRYRKSEALDLEFLSEPESP